MINKSVRLRVVVVVVVVKNIRTEKIKKRTDLRDRKRKPDRIWC